MLSIVLSRKDIFENDQIISIYTQEQGKVELLARGVKKITSKNQSNLEPASLVEIEILHGKDLKYVGSVEAIESFSQIKSNWPEIYLAGASLNILNKNIKENSGDRAMFLFILDWLSFLNSRTNKNFKNIFTSFILKFCSHLGYAPQVKKCVDCGINFNLGSQWFFESGRGGIVCRLCMAKVRFADQKLRKFDGDLQNIFLKLLNSDFVEQNNYKIPKNKIGDVDKIIGDFWEARLGYSPLEIKEILTKIRICDEVI